MSTSGSSNDGKACLADTGLVLVAGEPLAAGAGRSRLPSTGQQQGDSDVHGQNCGDQAEGNVRFIHAFYGTADAVTSCTEIYAAGR